MKKYLILLFLFFIGQQLFCQSFYAKLPYNLIKRVTINGTNIIVEDIGVCTDIGQSIAFYKGALYYENGPSLGKAVLDGNSFVSCSDLFAMPIGNSLTVDVNGMLYSVSGNTLYIGDPITETSSKAGNLPFSSAGDLVFYKNNLYMAALNGIVKVDISDPAKSSLVIPDNFGRIYGLATVAYTTTQNKVYALRNTNTGGTDILELDLDNNLLGQVVGTLPFGVLDAASTTEDGSTAKITIDAIGQYPICDNPGKTTVQVVCVNATSSYQYTLNGITNNTGVFTIDPGNYTLFIQSPIDNLSQPLTVQAVDFEKPVLNISKNDYTCSQVGQISIAAQANGDLYRIKYENDIFRFDHTFTNLLPGNYHFEILNLTQCVVETADVTVGMDGCETIDFPNTFTPNGDGINDIFRPLENSLGVNFRLSIYNRYGAFIFNSTDLINGWNGNYQGKQAPAGVYFWIAKYTNIYQKAITKKGYVTLIR